MLRKVVALSSPLLKDSSMKAVVIQSKETISTGEERCQEAEVRCRMNSSFIKDYLDRFLLLYSVA